jgi:hypothetical protein
VLKREIDRISLHVFSVHIPDLALADGIVNRKYYRIMTYLEMARRADTDSTRGAASRMKQLIPAAYCPPA